jgi:hypothetical protein
MPQQSLVFRLVVLALLASLAAQIGCARRTYYPQRAADAYPRHLHTHNAIDIQVFRDGTSIELVNATPRSFEDFQLWINQRYVQRIAVLPAGGRLRLSLWDFYDERGEIMNAGGFFRVYEPDPVRLVQIQVDDQSPLLGLVTIRDEPLEER